MPDPRLRTSEMMVRRLCSLSARLTRMIPSSVSAASRLRYASFRSRQVGLSASVWCRSRIHSVHPSTMLATRPPNRSRMSSSRSRPPWSSTASWRSAATASSSPPPVLEHQTSDRQQVRDVRDRGPLSALGAVDAEPVDERLLELRAERCKSHSDLHFLPRTAFRARGNARRCAAIVDARVPAVAKPRGAPQSANWSLAA